MINMIVKYTIPYQKLVRFLNKRIKDKLINILKKEFNRKEEWQEKLEYQWVLGVSIKFKVEGLSLYRIVVKFSES